MVVIIIRLIFFDNYQPWYYQADNFLDSYQPLYYQAEPLDPAPVFELSWFLRVNSYSLPTGWLNSVCILSDIAYWGNKGNFKILLSLLHRELSFSLFFFSSKASLCIVWVFFGRVHLLICWYFWRSWQDSRKSMKSFKAEHMCSLLLLPLPSQNVRKHIALILIFIVCKILKKQNILG